ncbi:MAG: hypothetical protein IJF92_03035 [Bacilli bacterium]|nr:hypothetical protein [Bacilli bacterium]
MDVFIAFFRDVLDGPIYITSTVISVILICAGIGYFAEKKQNREQAEKKFNDTHVKIENTHANETNNNVSTGAQKTTISNVNVNSNQYNVSDSINRGKVESKVVPEVLAPTQPIPNVQTAPNTNYNNQNMVYQNNVQTQNNNINYNNQYNSQVSNNTNYNNQNNMETSSYYNSTASNQPNTNYNNQNQIYNNTNINNNFTN